MSNLIANEKFDHLHGLVWDEPLEQIKSSYLSMSAAHKKSLIGIKPRDVSRQVLHGFEIFQMDKIYVELSVMFFYMPAIYDLMASIARDTKNESETVLFNLALVKADYKYIFAHVFF